MYLPEIIQTKSVIEVEEEQVCAIVNVYHHDILADDNTSVYLHGMADMYVIRYLYVDDDDRYVL